MDTIGIIGLLLAISCLIVLSYKGVNAFIASLIASVVVIITNALPFWETLAGSYATGFKNFAGNYFLLFGLAAAYVPWQSFSQPMSETESLCQGTVFADLVQPYERGQRA